MARPLISVITPSFNQGKYIEQTIRSVLEQQYEPFEHLVMDGGSTDETLEILARYPHLSVVSEPDDGQADALEKGLLRARGEVVAWINSDDWYAPGIFHEVAKRLEYYPIVLGACAIVDERGRLHYEVANVERSWFDMLKYWTPYSIPAQPAIFVRRELLEEARRNDGSLFDRSLHFVMDYDLWMRLAKEYPFSARIPRVAAYYRMTDDNKTSLKIPGMPYAEPEMARVFRRAENERFPSSEPASIVLPVLEGRVADASIALERIRGALKGSFEVVVVECGASKPSGELRRAIAMANEASRAAGVDSYARVIACSGRRPSEAVEAGARDAAGRLVIVLPRGVAPEGGLLPELSSLFANNRIGLATPGAAPPPGQSMFERIVAFQGPQWVFAARRVLLLELGSLSFEPEEVAFHALMARTLALGWEIVLNAPIPLSVDPSFGGEAAGRPLREAGGALREVGAPPQERVIAAAGLAAVRENERSPFARVRQTTGYGLAFDEETERQLRQIFRQAFTAEAP